ncbi:hypothetical protein [Streptomyces sp. CB03911]|nr:hypothetical protein [Streptomyces sp. CB03911]
MVSAPVVHHHGPGRLSGWDVLGMVLAMALVVTVLWLVARRWWG